MLLAALVTNAPATGWSKDSLTERIAQERRELATLQQELNRIRKQRDLVSSRERSVAERLQETERALAITRRALRLAELDVAQKDADILRATRTLAQVEAGAQEARRRARIRIREMAKRQAVGYGRFVLAAGGDIAVRYDAVRIIVHRDRRVLLDAQTAASTVTEQVQTLERLKREMDDVRRLEREALIAVAAERETRRRLLLGLRAEKVAYTRSIEDLEEASRNLEVLIDELVRASLRPSPGTGFARNKGRLIWPSTGEVVGTFGRQKHPRFETYVDRKGIEIRANGQAAIRAIAEGRVAYADRLKGYGLIVIVDHGDRYLSLYAHAASLTVRAGDRVNAGQAIGRTSAGDERLYFELRHGKDPLDPIGWLLTRGGRE